MNFNFFIYIMGNLSHMIPRFPKNQASYETIWNTQKLKNILEKKGFIYF